jgi:type 1 glutamine amidotransferase
MRHPAVTAFAVLLSAAVLAPAADADKIKALIVDGQNNHKWRETTPVLKQILESSGRFTVDVATSPEKGSEGFRPKFADYGVVVLNYNGAPWPAETKADFVKYVEGGGGVTVVHAANNAFGDWAEYNQIIGVGGWGGRSEKSGPQIRLKDGKMVLDETPGRGGSHGKQHEFVVETIAPDHPIVKDMPAKWKHTQDELYDRLRGPAKNVTLLAVAYSDKATGGTGEKEPMIFTVDFGKGRVFHTPMGHDVKSLRCVGFASVLERGSEWAATGKVTLPVRKDFPTEEKSSPLPEK